MQKNKERKKKRLYIMDNTIDQINNSPNTMWMYEAEESPMSSSLFI